MQPPSHCPVVRHARSPAATTSRSSRGSLLRGRCRHCDAPISVRYPLVELLTGVLFAAVGARFAAFVGAARVPRADRRADRALARSTSSTTSSRTASCTRSACAAIVLLAVASLLEARLGRVRTGAARRRGRVRVLLRHPPRRRRAAWASATCASRSCSACFLGWLGWGEVSGGLFAGLPLRRGHRRRADRGQGKRGRKQHIPFGPVPRGRGDDLRARSASRSSTGTGTRPIVMRSAPPPKPRVTNVLQTRCAFVVDSGWCG